MRETVSEYVTIEQAGNEAIADLIKQRLDQSGIPCRLVPGALPPWPAREPPTR